MKVYEITVRCANDIHHAKKLRLKNEVRDWVDQFAALIDGSSAFYILKPGELSPIGKCATCGGQLRCEVEEVQSAIAKE